eukprot:g28310.t1
MFTVEAWLSYSYTLINHPLLIQTDSFENQSHGNPKVPALFTLRKMKSHLPTTTKPRKNLCRKRPFAVCRGGLYLLVNKGKDPLPFGNVFIPPDVFCQYDLGERQLERVV